MGKGYVHRVKPLVAMLILVALAQLALTPFTSCSYHNPEVELSYDDGTVEGFAKLTGCKGFFAVRFDAWRNVTVTAVKAYLKGGGMGVVLVSNVDFTEVYANAEFSAVKGWNTIKLPKPVTVKDGVFIVCLIYEQGLGYDSNSTPSKRSFRYGCAGWIPQDVNYMIRAVVLAKKVEEEKYETGEASLTGFLEGNGYITFGSKIDREISKKLKEKVKWPFTTVYNYDPGTNLIIVGGPIACKLASRFNEKLGISFRRFKNGLTLSVDGVAWNVTSRDWGKLDYGVVAFLKEARRCVLLLEGCTRYGTEAAVKLILEQPLEQGFTVLVLKWSDLNGDGLVSVDEVKIVYRV